MLLLRAKVDLKAIAMKGLGKSYPSAESQSTYSTVPIEWAICTVLNKSWKQHSTKQQQYGYLPPISQTIQNEQDTPDTTREVKTIS